MANQHKNKIIYGGTVLIDLTGDTVDAAHLLTGYTAHDKSGAPVTGTLAYDADTSDDTAIASELLAGKTAHARGVQLTGEMPNNGAVAGTIATRGGVYTVPQGYHDGSGTVQIDATEQAKIIAGNIKSGVSILGVTGDYGGESVSAQAKTATPSTAQQTILPDSGYDYLSQVTVSAIPYVEADNAAGGVTVTIG